MGEVNDEYVNVKDALHRIGGSMDLYKRLLTQFTGTDHIGPLKAALDSGDAEDACRKLHALKGVSANLSLVKLSEISAALEYMVKDGVDHTTLFEELKDVYDITSQQIAEII